jgi:hypothetical protein
MNDKEKVAQWMIKQGFATGHGDSIEDLLKELDEQIGRRMVRQRNNFGKVLLKAVADEREACAKVCDEIMQYYKTNTTMNTDQNLIGYMAAEVCGVRIRGKK